MRQMNLEPITQTEMSQKEKEKYCILMHIFLWRRKWQPTPVFLPGESQGWGSLVDCRLWGSTELDMTEAI